MADVESLRAADPRSLGRYELLGRLGEGAQGIVFLAREPARGAQVAVKLLRAHLSQDDASRSRFLREVSTAKRVARFCTAQVLDADLAGAQPYIVSEYIPGPSLAAVVRSGGPRSGTALERIAVHTATALAGIHQAGIIHRDFKASNVLLGPDGPVVIDFGIAKALDAVDSELTLPGHSAGTPSSMAPEQFAGGPAGPAADIFAWGVTMAFAATGTLPFGAGQVPALMYRILNEPPRLDGFTGPLRDLVTACLEKDPAARPTAREIVDRLLGREDLGETAAAALPPSHVRPGPPAGAAAPTDIAAADATPPLDAGPPFDALGLLGTGPIRAVQMDPLQTADVRTPRPDRPVPWRSRRVRAWGAAAAVLVLAGGAVAVTAFSGSADTRKSPGPHADAAGLPRGSAAAASPAVSPGKPGKKRTARGNGTPAHASQRIPAHAVSSATTAAARSGTSPVSAPPPAPASPKPAVSGVPNPYTPTGVCGSGYGVIDSHALTGGTIYLLYDSATGKNCVTTMRSAVSGKITMTAALKVEGGPSASDSGQYSDYAGPVALPAAATCVEWGGSIGGSSWTSSWSHCG